MVRNVFLPAALIAVVPAGAAAQWFAPSLTQTHLTTREIARSYWDTPNVASDREALSKLKRLCRSRDRDDRRRCENSWRIINAHYAELQAHKAGSK